jgi:hypothetical protein
MEWPNLDQSNACALKIENFIFVGAASCRDGLTVAAGCRSYKKQGAIQSKALRPIECTLAAGIVEKLHPPGGSFFMVS